MEALILFCLFTIIGLLLWDYRPNTSSKTIKESLTKNCQQNNDVIGLPKQNGTIRQTLNPEVQQVKSLEELGDGLIYEIPDGHNSIIWKEGPDDAAFMPNFEEEEEEWRENNNFYNEGGFATGLTFEELNTLGAMLEQKGTENTAQSEILQIVRKLDGTELLSLLESSIINSSQKIAMLLDKNFDSASDSISFVQSESIKNFDVKNFT